MRYVGPLPLLGDPGHRGMVEHLRHLAAALPRPPRALVVVSPHWEVSELVHASCSASGQVPRTACLLELKKELQESRPTVTSGEQPELMYDYSGFPEEAYKVSILNIWICLPTAQENVVFKDLSSSY